MTTSDREPEGALPDISWRRLADQVPAAVFLHPLERNQPPFYISPRIEEVTGYRLEELLTQRDFLARFVHPEDSAAMKPMGERTDRTLEPFIATYRLRRKDGRWVWLYNHTEIVRDDAGAPLYWQGFVIDVTAQKEAELETARALELQRQANEELVALGRERAEFLAMLAHDLRTPLTAILGMSDLLRARGGQDPEVARFLETISANAGRMNRMVNEMLAAESLESRLGRIETEPADLDELVRLSAASVGAAWPQREIALDLAGGLPAITVDHDAIVRALTNLLGNALAYSPAGEPVRVATRRAGDALEVRVTDRGVGIPQDRLERIFDRHVRVRTHATREIEGFGLGLPIVRAIARAHGGDVTAESVEGEGSTFTLRLPIAAASARSVPVALPAPEPAAAPVPAGPARATPFLDNAGWTPPPPPRPAPPPPVQPARLSDALWREIAPLLPVRPAQPKGGRPWVDDRAAICGILDVLWGGATWASIPSRPGAPSPVTCWRRLRQWQATGIWDEMLRRLEAGTAGTDGAAWERACPRPTTGS